MTPARVWYVRDPEGGIEEYYSADEAERAAHGLLDHYRENAPLDGWPSDIDCLEWGEMIPEESARVDESTDEDGRVWWDVALLGTGVSDG